MTNEAKTDDVVAEVLAVYAEHKGDPHPAVVALRRLLGAYADAGLKRAELLMALGCLGGEAGEGERLAALRLLTIPRATLERLLAEMSA